MIEIYYDKEIKHIRFGEFGMAYEDILKIFKQIYPEYISHFKGNDNKTIAIGFDNYISDYYGLCEALDTQEYSGEYIIYKLVQELSPYLTQIIKNRRIYEKKHTKLQWYEKMILFNFKCAYCGKSGIQLTKDHVIPISKGGTDDIENIVPCCRQCNSSKGTKSAPQNCVTRVTIVTGVTNDR
jgi:hypothetical protein